MQAPPGVVNLTTVLLFCANWRWSSVRVRDPH
jgi:hypothetical protein